MLLASVMSAFAAKGDIGNFLQNFFWIFRFLPGDGVHRGRSRRDESGHNYITFDGALLMQK